MIICCGEALIDMLPCSLDSGELAYIPAAGGAVFNTAVSLGRLGDETSFFSGISTDFFGQKLISTLSAAGVNCDNSIRSALPTTLAFVVLKDGHAEYTFYDENSAGKMIAPKELPQFPPVIAAHFGAISLIGDPCGLTYETLAMQLKDRAIISIDPNIRPNFVTDEKSYRARLDRMCEIADIIKLSDDDLQWLQPNTTFEECAHQWLAGNTQIVVLTKGEQGATAVSKSFEITVAAVETTVADTVGAGDSFNAGLLSGLRQRGFLEKKKLKSISEDDLRFAMEFAADVSAVTVSRPGADPPWRHELNL